MSQVTDQMVEKALEAFYGPHWFGMNPDLQERTRTDMRRALEAALVEMSRG